MKALDEVEELERAKRANVTRKSEVKNLDRLLEKLISYYINWRAEAWSLEKKREWKATQLRWREMQKLMRGFMALKRLLLKEEKTRRSRLLL